ncbi:3'-5' exonuclease-like [Apium graveolens]|uniref:3'-5' exonuclease-like n=1 Tax=Apium graveolens TaxID=4045 RepID=UPI003D791E59
MTVTIYDHELPYETHNLYDISFFSTNIRTLLTYHSSRVTSWLHDVTRSPSSSLIGFDVEWRPNFQRNQDNRIATIQLCTGTNCLIYHIIHADTIPQSLVNFLNNTDYTFVGVGIGTDVEKLLDDYGIGVGKFVDLRAVAASVCGIRELKNAGLKELTRVVLEKEISKPKSVTMSRWDNSWLTSAQVMYACVDAYVAYEIARVLNVV